MNSYSLICESILGKGSVSATEFCSREKDHRSYVVAQYDARNRTVRSATVSCSGYFDLSKDKAE